MKIEGEVLNRVIQKLVDADIPYMVVGSTTSGAYGQYRTTNDIDIIIDPTLVQINILIKAFGEGYYISPGAAKQAFFEKGIFNVIDDITGWKIDFILLKSEPFSKNEFARRIPGILFGVPVIIASAEDTILSKLLWSKQTESERQLRDALGVLVVQWKTIDRSYLQHWAQILEITELLDKIISEAEKI